MTKLVTKQPVKKLVEKPNKDQKKLVKKLDEAPNSSERRNSKLGVHPSDA